MIKQILRNSIRWALSAEIRELSKIREEHHNKLCSLGKEVNRFKKISDSIQVSVDVHEQSSSWACISIQGQKDDFIKFIDLERSDIVTISKFLGQFERRNVKANPCYRDVLKFK